jgi:hypothetical protein
MCIKCRQYNKSIRFQQEILQDCFPGYKECSYFIRDFFDIIYKKLNVSDKMNKFILEVLEPRFINYKNDKEFTSSITVIDEKAEGNQRTLWLINRLCDLVMGTMSRRCKIPDTPNFWGSSEWNEIRHKHQEIIKRELINRACYEFDNYDDEDDCIEQSLLFHCRFSIETWESDVKASIMRAIMEREEEMLEL